MTKQCPVCGTIVPDNSNFCSHCGNDLTRRPNERNYGQTQQTPPPISMCGQDPNNPFDSAGPEGKCRGIAALFAILFSGLGVHYFYCGKTVAGFLTILLSILTCGLWSFVMVVQGIYLFCITNAEFERKFVAGTSTFPVF